MNSEICPQCKTQINKSTNRLIQDNCGHKKCRVCLLQEETGCKICANLEINLSSEDNSTAKQCKSFIIKYDYSQVETLTKQTSAKVEESTESDFKDTETEAISSKQKTNKSLIIPNHITVVSKLPLLYKCTICSKSFSTNGSVKYHSYCGGLEKPLKCEICNKGFISNSHLTSHKLKHSGIRPFKCSICQKTFIQKSKLNRHSKLHTGERPFICSECGKKFTNKDALLGHSRTHNGEKPFVCKQCGNRFNNKSNLTKHQSTHSKEKPYMCEQCGKKFGNKWALISHRKLHVRERLFPCQMCSKSFTNKKDLRRHGFIHLGTRPYSCKLCNAKFCRKDNLERHLKNTHSIKDTTEIKLASIKTPVNISIINSVSSNVKQPKSDISKPEIQPKPIHENPNAINVIKTSHELLPKPIKNAVPVINGPFKLAFKTDAFKNNYNIFNREYTELPARIPSKKPYDMAESLNICQKIMSPMTAIKSDKVDNNNTLPVINKTNNVITSIGKVNEKESLEICRQILQPTNQPPLHYETSFEHKKHAIIKNIKFKLPSTYTDNISKHSENNNSVKEIPYLVTVKPVLDAKYDIENNTNELTELQPMKLNYTEITNSSYCKQSVIVNHHTSETPQNDVPFTEMHWRRRTLQNLQTKI